MKDLTGEDCMKKNHKDSIILIIFLILVWSQFSASAQQQHELYSLDSNFIKHGSCPMSFSVTIDTDRPDFLPNDIYVLTMQTWVFQCTVHGGIAPFKYTWNFGDTSGNEIHEGISNDFDTVSHQYAPAGCTYELRVIVQDSSSPRQTVSDTATIHVCDPLTVTIGQEYYNGNAGVPIHFEGIVTGGASPYHFIWDFGNGDTYELTNIFSGNANVDYSYPAPGSWTITLTVDCVVTGEEVLDNAHASIGSFMPMTVYVGGTGLGNYTTIQDGINHVGEGGIVNVYSGTYPESISIDKPLTLCAASDPLPSIIGGPDHVIEIIASNVEVSEFILTKDTPHGVGIRIDSSASHIRLIGNQINNVGYGILLGGNDHVLRFNSFHSNNQCKDDLIVYGSNNLITLNSFQSSTNSWYHCIVLGTEATNNCLYHNNFFQTTSGHTAIDSGNSNIWNEENNGNYWSDWQTNPGYPSSVYNIPGSAASVDHHPLANPINQ
jgi:hypothetical protein